MTARSDGVASPILGSSAAMRRVRALIAKVAPTSLPVLIQGPTGSGKELVARALHDVGGRSGRFVAFNVCAIAESMFEDALFGHVRGAFTGAHSDSPGYLAEANAGTAFFDEIGGLGVGMQAKLLRAIETREFRPVGSARDRRSDFRVIAATNETVHALVDGGRLRSDLAHRLSGVVIVLPPLCDRAEDLAELAVHFLARSEIGGHQLALSEAAIATLRAYSWPGNARQLRRVIEHAAVMTDAPTIDDALISDLLAQEWSVTERGADAAAVNGAALTFARRRFEALLADCDWDTARAAEQLAVHRTTVYRRMRLLGIPAPKLSRGAEALAERSRNPVRANSHPVAANGREPDSVERRK